MLFTSTEFIFWFLPITFVVFHLVLRTWGGERAIAVLVAASAVFYGIWSLKFLTLLVAQLLANWLVAGRLQTTSRRGLWLALAVTANLALLGYFKYRNFFLQTVTDLGGPDFHLMAIFVPLGISFHTFQQIAFLSDVAQEDEERPSLLHYVMFVLFFPQLIAGPVVLHQEIGQQLDTLSRSRAIKADFIIPGLVIFLFGLFKKVCLADTIAPYADAAFEWPVHLQMLEAWGGLIAYALQLFLDFSGYSDMAVGLGLMFGLKLPHNFNVPFRATGMVDFWGRWHITMTRFFTMYLFSPLALSFLRRSETRGDGRLGAFLWSLAIPVMITFLASGLWHGAGWTFIVFGLINGVGVVINHGWNAAKLPRLPAIVGWPLTALCVLVGWVFFRAQSMAQSLAFLAAMFDVESFGLPDFVTSRLAGLHLPPALLPSVFFEVFSSPVLVAKLVAGIVILGALSVWLPNPSRRPFDMRPSWPMAFALSFAVLLSMGWINNPRTFLYFQF